MPVVTNRRFLAGSGERRILRAAVALGTADDNAGWRRRADRQRRSVIAAP